MRTGNVIPPTCISYTILQEEIELKKWFNLQAVQVAGLGAAAARERLHDF